MSTKFPGGLFRPTNTCGCLIQTSGRNRIWCSAAFSCLFYVASKCPTAWLRWIVTAEFNSSPQPEAGSCVVSQLQGPTNQTQDGFFFHPTFQVGKRGTIGSSGMRGSLGVIVVPDGWDDAKRSCRATGGSSCEQDLGCSGPACCRCETRDASRV
jgi:hypothetical protein